MTEFVLNNMKINGKISNCNLKHIYFKHSNFKHSNFKHSNFKHCKLKHSLNLLALSRSTYTSSIKFVILLCAGKIIQGKALD
ncbi:pentapeptide repeat-containing protein [Colwellia sp. C1TZA3]|uniref:pentapeptide repeat-containing protein n=1 Tax=Colwellia sp. C1TZA3 TaxID=2508879 RepID=UPI0011BA2AA1|nr:pentapeptide repeat-containing protein [Colwellia sp. C1TZA3]